MPIYDFQCKECGHVQEQLTSISESSKLRTCPSCGKKAFEKVLSMPTSAPILKGTGFYQTDFRGK